MKLTSIYCALAGLAGLGSVNAFSLPRLVATRALSKALPRAAPRAAEKRIVCLLPAKPLSKIQAGSQLAETTEAAAADPEKAASIFLSILVVDAVTATKELALNWGFVLNSGIVKVIGGFLALGVPFFATEVALNVIGLALACVSAFNIAGLFNAQNGFKLQSFLVGSVQAFLAYRISLRPFESLRILTSLVAAASLVDGIFETVVAVQNSELPGRWALLFSGLASMAGGAFVGANLSISSLFILGILLGANLLSSGWSSILAALKGREIANAYLLNANFEKDAFAAIETVAETVLE